MISRRKTTSRLLRVGAAGFTLLEVVVVLAILGFALVLILGYRPPWSRGFDVDTTAAELASELRLVRSEAIATNRTVAFKLDLKGHRYRVGLAASRALPVALSIKLLTVAGEQGEVGAAGIRFNPDGSSTGGRIVLADGTRRVAVGVDWLTGKVSVVDVR
jgi:general secretion pathway protein H